MSDVVIAIDLSVSCTGFAVSINDKVLAVSRIVTDPNNYSNRFRRYGDILSQIMRVIKKYQVTVAVIEGYSYGSFGNAMLDLAELGGIVRRALLESGIWLYEIAVQSYRKIVTGHGHVKCIAGKDIKARVKRFVTDTYEIDVVDDNEADAVLLLMAYLHYTDKFLDKAVQLHG